MMTILSHKHSRTLAIYRHQDHFFCADARACTWRTFYDWYWFV